MVSNRTLYLQGSAPAVTVGGSVGRPIGGSAGPPIARSVGRSVGREHPPAGIRPDGLGRDQAVGERHALLRQPTWARHEAVADALVGLQIACLYFQMCFRNC